MRLGWGTHRIITYRTLVWKLLGEFSLARQKKEKGRKDTIKIDVRLVVRMKSGRNWRYYSVAV